MSSRGFPPFDTLELAKRLGEGGLTSQQAQAVAAALSDALEIDKATKTDLERAVQTAKLELEAKIVDSKAEIIKWFIGIIGFQTLVLLGGLVSFLEIFIK